MLKSSASEEDEGVMLDHALLEEVDHKYFYDGTVRGWLSKYQKQAFFFAAITVIASVVIVLAVVWASRELQSPPGDDDDDRCWPKLCYESVYAEAETTFYYEPVEDIPYINATLIGDWDFVYPTPTNRDLFSVAKGSNLLVAVGADNTQLVMDLVAGGEWTLSEPIDRSARSSSFRSVYYAAERFWTSTDDGRGYSRLDLPEQPWLAAEHSFSSGISSDPSQTLFIGLEEDRAWLCDTDISADLWTEILLPGDIGSLTATSYLNGKFVIVGTVRKSEELYDELQFSSWVSSDGESWASSASTNHTLYSTNVVLAAQPTREAYNGKWLVFADRLLYSRDGLVWTPYDMSPWNEFSSPQSMACSMNYCVAITSGFSGQAMVSITSDGGLTWLSAILSHELHEVIFDGFDSFLIVGGGGTILRGRIAGIDDHVTWSEEGAAAQTEIVLDVAYLSGQFIATTGTQQLLVSDDGQAWAVKDAPPLHYIAHGEQTFAGAAFDGAHFHIYTSNGTIDNWALAARFDGNYDIRQLTYDGHQFIGCGRRCDSCAADDDDDDDDVYQPITVQSPNGVDWQVLDAEGVEGTFLVQVVWNPVVGNFLGRASDGKLYNGRDLDSWEEISSNNHWYSSIAVDQVEGNYMALGRDRGEPALRLSVDGGHQWQTLACTPDPLLTVLVYDYASKATYLAGGSFCIASLEQDHLACNTIRMEVDAVQDFAIGGGVALLLADGGLITAAVETLDYTVQC